MEHIGYSAISLCGAVLQVSERPNELNRNRQRTRKGGVAALSHNRHHPKDKMGKDVASWQRYEEIKKKLRKLGQ